MKSLMMNVTILACVACASVSLGANGSQPVGEPQLERPTLHSLGVYWIVRGDDNQNALVRLEYRKAGAESWRPGAPLFRVERKAHLMERFGSQLQVPDDGWLFAGSVLLLEPGTEYELKVTLADPDGSEVSRTLPSKTRTEPRIAATARKVHVVPGSGGGSGTADDPYKGLAAAQQAAAPGDLFLIRAGVYKGPWEITKSGAEGQPIVWRGSGDGEAIIEGPGQSEKPPSHAIQASGARDVWFENLTIRNANYGMVIHDAVRLVIRRCHIHKVEYGMTGTRDSKGIANDHFISDNVLEGPSTWPRTKGIEDARGIQITGQGHVVCYNRIRGFADAIDTFPSARCAAIDFHNNDVSELTDDGIEMDYSERNTRCFYNRLTNVFQGISEQPIHGGPVYIFRNVMYNVGVEPFKLHNSPSGALIFHNTSVKIGMPTLLYTSEKVSHCMTRNNLFVGTTGNYAFECTAPMVDCDFDYDGFAGGPFKAILSWNHQRYTTLDELRNKAPVEKHAALVAVRGSFIAGALPPDDPAKEAPRSVDLRLSPVSEAIDRGQALPGWNDGFKGRAPDLGAYELGDPLPHYGPRSEGKPAGE
jgi:hypothetical protein